MVTIVTSKRVKPLNVDIFENDGEFISTLKDSDFLRDNAQLLWKYDRAKITDYSTMMMQTPYGSTFVDNLSTGLKTLLNIKYWLYVKKKTSFVVNITECGENVLEDIFKVVDNTGVVLYCEASYNKGPRGFKFNINGTNYDSLFYLIDEV